MSGIPDMLLHLDTMANFILKKIRHKITAFLFSTSLNQRVVSLLILKGHWGAFMYQAVISQSHMHANSQVDVSSVYQLMRPVDSLTTLQSNRQHKSRHEERHTACLFCWGPHANQTLVPFQNQNTRISISAIRYELACFVFCSSICVCIYHVRADTVRDSSCIEVCCLLCCGLDWVFFFSFTYKRRQGFGSYLQTDICLFSLHT